MRKTVPGKDRFEEYDSLKSALRQASIREKKGPSLGKIQVKNPHQRSPYAMKFEDRSHEGTERQQRCARSKAWNLAKKHLQAQKTRLHSTHPRRNGYSRRHQQKSQRKVSLWQIPEQVCKWSASETLTLLSWRPRGYRGVRRRWWRPTARGKQEKKRRYMSKNWTYSSRLCFLKKLPQFFLPGRSWEYPPLEQCSRTTSHPKRQKNQFQCIELRIICCSWSVDEFLYIIFTWFFNIFIAVFCGQYGKSSNRKKWDCERGATGKPVAWISIIRKHK